MTLLVGDDDDSTKLALSPVAEWGASPMGLAGRDPIFYAQLESEVNRAAGEEGLLLLLDELLLDAELGALELAARLVLGGGVLLLFLPLGLVEGVREAVEELAAVPEELLLELRPPLVAPR